MSKFHINPSTGNPGRCFALKKCRFGGDDEHYGSKELAALAYERFHATDKIPILKKSDAEPKKKLEDFAVQMFGPKGDLLTDEKIAEAEAKFQNLKESSSKMMDDFKTPFELKTPIEFSDDAITTSVRYSEGRALVSVAGSSETNFDGDYPIGDLMQDSDTVVRLLEADPDLQFINGECATLAWDLYDAYPDQVKCVSEIWVKGDVGSMHVIAELKDGSFIDGLGHWTPSGILAAWNGLMGKDVEIRLGEVDKDHKKKAALFASTKILGKYLDSLP